VLDREAVADGACAQTTIPLLRERLSRRGQIKGALVLIDAIACNADPAQAIRDAGADCLLAGKAHQPGLMSETEAVFADPKAEVAATIDTDTGHGRIGERAVRVLTSVDRHGGDRRLPGEYRFPDLRLIARVECRRWVKSGIWEKPRQAGAIRVCVASRPMTPQTRAGAVRSHWAIRNSLHRVPDVTFGKDKARSRTGCGPANMAAVRHRAFNILEAADDTRSLKTHRNKAERTPEFMASITGQTR
jgi:predicted transposase YbfD/YdcC